MICDPVINERDLQEAAFVVSAVFSRPINTDDGLELLRGVFGEVWPHWGDAELLQALRAALVVH